MIRYQFNLSIMRTRISEDYVLWYQAARIFLIVIGTLAVFSGVLLAILALPLFWYFLSPPKVLDFDQANLYVLENAGETIVPLSAIRRVSKKFWQGHNQSKNVQTWEINWQDETGALQSLTFIPTQNKKDWIKFKKCLGKQSPEVFFETRKFYGFWGFEDDRA